MHTKNEKDAQFFGKEPCDAVKKNIFLRIS